MDFRTTGDEVQFNSNMKSKSFWEDGNVKARKSARFPKENFKLNDPSEFELLPKLEELKELILPEFEDRAKLSSTSKLTYTEINFAGVPWLSTLLPADRKYVDFGMDFEEDCSNSINLLEPGLSDIFDPKKCGLSTSQSSDDYDHILEGLDFSCAMSALDAALFSYQRILARGRSRPQQYSAAKITSELEKKRQLKKDLETSLDDDSMRILTGMDETENMLKESPTIEGWEESAREMREELGKFIGDLQEQLYEVEIEIEQLEAQLARSLTFKRNSNLRIRAYKRDF